MSPAPPAPAPVGQLNFDMIFHLFSSLALHKPKKRRDATRHGELLLRLRLRLHSPSPPVLLRLPSCSCTFCFGFCFCFCLILCHEKLLSATTSGGGGGGGGRSTGSIIAPSSGNRRHHNLIIQRHVASLSLSLFLLGSFKCFQSDSK